LRAIAVAFHPLGSWIAMRLLRRSIKCELVEGEWNGAPAVAKMLVHPDPIWRWYFDRERAIYDLFERDPPPVRAPKIHHSSDEMMIMEPLGPPLAAGRQVKEQVDPAPVLEMLEQLERWEPREPLPSTPPPPEILRALRDRLLEDPTGDWVRDGIDRAAELGILSHPERMHRALHDHPRRHAHGDLLPRNVLSGAVVDWECAGVHPLGWDRALLWVSFPAARDRLKIETPAFWALAAFAAAREVKFARRSSAPRRAQALAVLHEAESKL